MFVYNYDSKTKEYLSKENASIDPVATKRTGKNVYMLPTDATFKEPPKTEDLKVAIWDNDKWLVIDDFRGQYITDVNFNISICNKIGSLDDGYIYITKNQKIKIEQEPLYYIIENNKLVKNPNYITDKLNKAKDDKYSENDDKASKARYNKEFDILIQDKICIFDTTEQTQRDLLTAFAVCSTGITYDGWVTNNGVELNLTLDDVALISEKFKEKSNIYGIWNSYKTAIDNAQTYEEVEAIEVIYD